MKRRWVFNVQKTPKIRLSIGGETFEGTTCFLTDRAEHERVMAAIRRKYWVYWPIMGMGRILTATGPMRDNTPSFEVYAGRLDECQWASARSGSVWTCVSGIASTGLTLTREVID